MFNIENYYFIGSHNGRDTNLLLVLLIKLGIDRNNWVCNSIFKYYTVINNKITTYRSQRDAELSGKQEITIPEIIKNLLQEHPELDATIWWKALNSGSIVEVDPMLYNKDSYPGSLSSLPSYGKYVICSIYPRTLDSHRLNDPNFNGDLTVYTLEGYSGQVHSSIFVPFNSKPIKRLSLTELDLGLETKPIKVKKPKISDDFWDIF